MTIINAFGWTPTQLIGNDTIADLILKTIDLRSQKISIEKVIGKEECEKKKERIEEIQKECRGYVTLMDLATLSPLHLPMHLLEESTIIPRIKPRFFSVINDPFTGIGNIDLTSKGKDVELLFNLEMFQVADQTKLGLCTDFLSTVGAETEFKCQMGPSYRVLSLP
jgi:sulfite reductase alpha subunit-like flavoprotein